MPTYEYACTSCGNSWELEQRITEDPAKKCPECGKNTAKRQISSGGAFILKGGGWYADGYGSKKSSSSDSKADHKSTTSETKSASDDGAKGDTKGDVKKEAAADAGGDAKPKKDSGGGPGSGGSGGTDAKASAA